jgi:hypothetical protein
VDLLLIELSGIWRVQREGLLIELANTCSR